MTKKLHAIETQSIFDFKVVKDKGNIPPGCLAVLEGYATLSDDDTNRNTHFYPKGFWGKVLDNNAFVKEKLETKTFFGAFRHPEKDESPIPEFGNISHNIRSYKIDDTGVYIIMDILNTAQGRELAPLIEYGSKLGVSTRAYGEVDINDKGQKVPVLDKYMFVTWDMVSFPAFSKTRMKISDSVTFNAPENIFNTQSREEMISVLKDMGTHDAVELCKYLGYDAEEVLDSVDKKKCTGNCGKCTTCGHKEHSDSSKEITPFKHIINQINGELDYSDLAIKDTGKGSWDVYNDDEVICTVSKTLLSAEEARKSGIIIKDSTEFNAKDKKGTIAKNVLIKVFSDLNIQTTNMDGDVIEVEYVDESGKDQQAEILYNSNTEKYIWTQNATGKETTFKDVNALIKYLKQIPVKQNDSVNLSGELDKAIEKVVVLENENTILKTTVGELTKKLGDGLDVKVQQLEKENNDLKGRIDTLVGEAKSHKATIQALEDSVQVQKPNTTVTRIQQISDSSKSNVLTVTRRKPMYDSSVEKQGNIVSDEQKHLEKLLK